MKSLFLSVVLSLGVISGAKGLSTSLVLNPGQFTNFVNYTGTGRLVGPIKVSQVLISSSTTNIANVGFVDTPTNALTNVVGASTWYTQYATNLISSWTNYYGVVNTVTNYTLVTATNTFNGATNNYNIPFQVSIPTNSVSKFDQATYTFGYGLWATNAVAPGSGPATITIVYTQ